MFCLGVILFLVAICGSDGLVFDQVPIMELFTAKIDPQMFNWTYQGVTQQFRYRPSIEGYPDLPSWMRYMYSDEYHAGFLYGTPPVSLANKVVRIEIVALNKQSYETRRKTLTIIIANKVPAANLVQMKIDNLDWVHLMDPGRVENLKNIFRKDLWPSSDLDLHLVFMESAVKMGGRVPLRPQQREGVIVHLGSNSPFSDRLKELQEEVRPLYKLSTCTYKRTSVQKVFENVGFKLDWCAFRIVGNEISPEVLYHNHGVKGAHGSELSSLHRMSQWNGMTRSEVPERNYIDELVFSIAIPGMIFAIGIGILSAVLCFQHERMQKTKQPTVQMVQCSETSNQPTTTLKSLKDPNLLIDNMSVRSQSPCNSVYHGESPRSGNTYIRPRPPPYKPPSLGKNCVDI
ncbi:epsilon-sarcoglycan isoform X2 [Hermetia illucens]|uniref:epsilon-sarcoglycan isoform X2 n=1 Tax=Hermetia illucens TaxID=343691 RepID=UPI0018CC22F0|nr:epsilon-sarcoglycan isoform X2 [Hermetia illucens]